MQNGTYVIKQNVSQSSLWKSSKQALLGRLDMELTERCNNNCVHCYINLPADDLNAKNKELTTEEIKKILEEAACLGCLNVRFTGGEPLLREDFEDLYIFSRRLGLRVTLFTNATLLTEHLVGLFSRIPPLEMIEITVYGMKKSSYEAATRTEGSFAAAWQGIDLLLRHKVPFVVKGALLPSSINEIEEFESWAATIPWMDKPPSFAMFFDLHCRQDRDKNELIKRLRLDPQQGVEVLVRRKNEYIREMREFCSKFMRPPGHRLFSCGAGRGGGCVDAYGKFQLCMMLRHPDFVYDLKKGNLRQAVEEFFPKMRETKAKNPEYLAKCARCFLKGLCEQCPAKSWAEHGILDAPVGYCCDIAHAQARYLGLLNDNEQAWEVVDAKERLGKFCIKEGVHHGGTS